MGEFSRLLRRDVNAYRKDRKCFKIVRTNGLVVKENTKLQNFDNISCLAFFRSGIYGWTFQTLWTSKTSCSYQKHCYRQKPPDCLWWSWKLIYTCLCQSEGIYLMKTVTELNISLIVGTKMIVCWVISFFVMFCLGCMADLPMLFFTERF